jgi:hypothetical protein
MAIQTMTIDPDATDDQTGDEIVVAINAGSDAIDRVSALDQDALKLILTEPASGQFKVKNVQRDSGGKLEVAYDDVAIP